MDWEKDVRPVLQALYQVIQANPQRMHAEADGSEVAELLGKDKSDEELWRVLWELKRTEYIDGHWTLGGGMPSMLQLSEKGYQAVAGWPSRPGDDVFVRLLDVLQERIDGAPTETERTRLEKFRDGAVGVGKDVLTDVLSKAATGAM